MTNQTTTNEANGKTYTYDIHSTKIYGTDKIIIKHLKSVLNVKSEYDVVNAVLEYFLNGHKTEIDILKEAKEQQKKATDTIRKKVKNQLTQIQ